MEPEAAGHPGRPPATSRRRRRRRRRAAGRRPAALGCLLLCLLPQHFSQPEESERRVRGRFLSRGAGGGEARAGRPTWARARERARAPASLRGRRAGCGELRAQSLQYVACEGAQGHLPHPEMLVPGTNCQGPFLLEIGLTL